MHHKKKIDAQIYKLMLSIDYNVIHSIIHEFLLESWLAWNNDSEAQPIFINNEKNGKLIKFLIKKPRMTKPNIW